jgi:hypothetical protein
MGKINLRIQLNRLKMDASTNYKKVFIILEANGKNHKSYSQKVKNGIVNFFGESINVEVNNNLLIIKAVALNQNGQ